MSVTEYKVLRAMLWHNPIGLDLRHSKHHQGAVKKLEKAGIVNVNRDDPSCIILKFLTY